MNERTKALAEAVELLRKNADQNDRAAREQAANGFYQCAADLKDYARAMDSAASIIETMYQPPECHDE